MAVDLRRQSAGDDRRDDPRDRRDARTVVMATVLPRRQSADDDRRDRCDARTKSSAMLVGACVVGRPLVWTDDPTAVLQRRDLPMRGIGMAPA